MSISVEYVSKLMKVEAQSNLGNGSMAMPGITGVLDTAVHTSAVMSC